MPTRRSRRAFLRDMGRIGAAIVVAPGAVRGSVANSALRLASIGVGGMGGADLEQLAAHRLVRVVGLCDTDENNLRAAAVKYAASSPQTFRDFREMFARIGDQIDAVNVATPDHMHAPAATSALQLGKHVYCQKPLTHTAHESRQLRLVSAEKMRITQMGIQVHSAAEYRVGVSCIRGGAIGTVQAVHSWSRKDWGYAGPAPQPCDPPSHLDWDRWLGPAPARPFAQGHYHPAEWRRWCDFGCGTMGDMGIHILDPVAMALQLPAPLTAVSETPRVPIDSHAVKNKVVYTFPKFPGAADGFTLTWYDGDWLPDSQDWPLPPGTSLPDQGSMFVGSDGYMLLPHVAPPLLLPREKFIDYQLPVHSSDNHWHLWVEGSLAHRPTTAGFDYAGPLTEMLLLGVIANRYPTQLLQYDSERLKITNFVEADAHLRRQYRSGWEITGLTG